MLSSNISFQNFKKKFDKKNVRKKLQIILNVKNTVLESLSQNYIDSYSQKKISKFNKFQNFIIIGMGGSILGIKSIFNFLKGKTYKVIFNILIKKKII